MDKKINAKKKRFSFVFISFDCYVNKITSIFQTLHESLECGSGVHDSAYDRIPANEHTAFRILGVVTDVDQHALEGGHVDDTRQLATAELVLFELAEAR